jgi:hypothetical protein
MNDDPASLANLRDIVEPSPVSWWPLAIGWWFLLTVVGLIALVVAFHRYRQWRANAYRRAGLRALQVIRGTEDLAAISELLKRVALAAYPRSQVASLSGSAWVKWLAETGGRPVPAAVSQALTVGIFAERGSADAGQLAAFAAEWIRSHTASSASGGPVRETIVGCVDSDSMAKQAGGPC